MAEGIANGGRSMMLHVDSLVAYNASRGFSQANMRHSQFVTDAGNRFLFVDRQSVAEVAVVVSLPSLLWRDFSSLTVPYDAGYNESHMNYYSVVSRVLSDRHVPFDIIILGYPRENLFDDTEQLARLQSGRYKTVVMPWVDALSDAHIAALRGFASVPGRRLAVVVPELTATLDEDLLPRAARMAGAAKVFAGVPFAPVSHELARKYYTTSDQAAGDTMLAAMIGGEGGPSGAAAGPKQPVIMEGSAETWIGNIWSHGGDAAAADGMRSVTLVNYNLTLAGQPWYSLKPRPQNESFPNCGMCGDFTPAVNLQVSVRCPGADCSEWVGTDVQYFAVELNSSVPLPVEFTSRPGYASCTVPFVRTLGVVVVGAGAGEIEARSSAAELRRWVNRRVKQEDGVEQAGAGVKAALVSLRQIHGRAAPSIPHQDYTALAAKFGAMAPAMKAAVIKRTGQLESLSATKMQEVKLQDETVYKIDVGALETPSLVAGFESLYANTTQRPDRAVAWISPANSSQTINQADCRATEADPLFATALWSERPAVLRLTVPKAGLYTITLWVGNCFSDQGGAFSPQGWEGRAEGNQSNYAWRGGPTMTAKVAITSASIVSAGTVDDQQPQQPTLTPVLLGDKVFSGEYSPRAFVANVSTGLSVDLRLSGSTGTSFLNHQAWSLSAISVAAAGKPLGTATASALAASNLLASAAVRDFFYVGPFWDSQIPPNASVHATQPFNLIDSNISKPHLGKLGALVQWRRWQQPDEGVRAPSVPLAWLLASGRGHLSQHISVGSVAFATTRLLCASTSGCPVVIEGSTSGLGACYINGVKVWDDLIVAGLLPREVRSQTHVLSHGISALLVSSRSDVVQSLDDPNAWGLRVSILDAAGTAPAPDVTVDACAGASDEPHLACNDRPPTPSPTPPIPAPPPPFPNPPPPPPPPPSPPPPSPPPAPGPPAPPSPPVMTTITATSVRRRAPSCIFYRKTNPSHSLIRRDHSRRSPRGRGGTRSRPAGSSSTMSCTTLAAPARPPPISRSISARVTSSSSMGPTHSRSGTCTHYD
jgi:hypothetical protein